MPYDQHIVRVNQRKEELKGKLEKELSGFSEISLEIGCGHGHWLVDYAAANQEKFCLGIDMMGSRIRRCIKKQERSGLPNVRFVQGEAFEVLETLPEKIKLEEVFILFPDPWPKKRHWKNRIINPKFLSQLATFCQQGVITHFRTDVEDYYNWAIEVVGGHPNWEITTDIEWPFERATVFQERSESYHSLIFRRV
ncbi:tRNA (guanosine(46)-N7)-methyltransferase TrmB [Puniceicoccaceae bacterium K14]|nr:tRNA (guanosine(46)-N7)-methyltransferase TrmB [Puniceicoccaceae bacterium K14]